MDLQLAGQRVLITGGSKGIGRAIAETLAAEGCHLRLVARDAAALDEVANAVRAQFPVEVETRAADLSTDATVRDVAHWAGKIDVLVNNAGAIPPGTLTSVDDAAWRSAWDLKVFGYISLSRAVYPMMAARKRGVIVNVIGAAGQWLPPGYIAGATGNAALMAFTKALARGSHAWSPSTPARSKPSAWKPCSAPTPNAIWATPTAGAKCSRRCRSAARPNPPKLPRPSPFWPARYRATRPARC
jgi:short-subunit dehydrogenase